MTSAENTNSNKFNLAENYKVNSVAQEPNERLAKANGTSRVPPLVISQGSFQGLLLIKIFMNLFSLYDSLVCVTVWMRNTQKYVSKSGFQHSLRTIATWLCKIKYHQTNKRQKTHNHIDDIIMDKSQTKTMIDARSYSNREITSDHRMVVARMQMMWSKLYNKKPKSEPPAKCFNSNKLTDEITKKKFQQDLQKELAEQEKDNFERVEQIIKNVNNEQLGFCNTKPNRQVDDDRLAKVSIQQTQIRKRIENSSDATKINELKAEKKTILKEMNRIIREIKEEVIDKVVKGMIPR